MDRSGEPTPQASGGFGDRVRRALFDHKVREVAKVVGVSQSAIYNWISGTNEPNLTKLAAFATATKVSIQWLITGTGEMRPGHPVYHSVTDLPYMLSAEAQMDAAAQEKIIREQQPLMEEIQRMRAEQLRLKQEIEDLKSKETRSRAPRRKRA